MDIETSLRYVGTTSGLTKYLQEVADDLKQLTDDKRREEADQAMETFSSFVNQEL